MFKKAALFVILACLGTSLFAQWNHTDTKAPPNNFLTTLYNACGVVIATGQGKVACNFITLHYYDPFIPYIPEYIVKGEYDSPNNDDIVLTNNYRS